VIEDRIKIIRKKAIISLFDKQRLFLCHIKTVGYIFGWKAVLDLKGIVHFEINF